MKRSILMTAILAVAVVYLAGPSKAPKEPTSKPADLGVCASLNDHRLFPADNPWNRDVSKDPVDPDSDKVIAEIGAARPLHPDFGTKYGIPYVVVTGKQRRVPVEFEYKDESDPGPYPIPPDAPIEGGADSKGDRHVLVLDRDHWKLYEIYSATPLDDGKRLEGRQRRDLRSQVQQAPPRRLDLRRRRGTADPAGPGAIRRGRRQGDHARHPLHRPQEPPRVPAAGDTLRQQPSRGGPAADGHARPPQGLLRHQRLRPGSPGDPQGLAEIRHDPGRQRQRLVHHRRPDQRWDDDVLNTLKKVKGRDFEVVKMEGIVTR